MPLKTGIPVLQGGEDVNAQQVLDRIKRDALDGDTEHLAKLAFAGGDKDLQAGRWPYVRHEARKLGLESAVVARVTQLKNQTP